MLALTGKRIALAEGRQLEELAAMLDKEGATCLRYPMLSILDAPDQLPVQAWINELIAGRFGLVILLTGEGLRRLLVAAERSGQREALIEAISKVRTITRGPKPGQALKEIGLKASKMAAAPTTDGVIQTLRDEALGGVTVGLQLYSYSNPPLTDYLATTGCTVQTVLPYIYAPAADSGKVIELIERMAQGEIDLIVFTSSPQITRIFEVAEESQLLPKLMAGFAKVKIASVGPVVNETLKAKGLPVDIAPEQGFQMKNLVVHIKRALGNPA